MRRVDVQLGDFLIVWDKNGRVVGTMVATKDDDRIPETTLEDVLELREDAEKVAKWVTDEDDSLDISAILALLGRSPESIAEYVKNCDAEIADSDEGAS